MRFLFPGFLFALSAVAIPILIHLFNFRKFKKIYFSNVRFLKDIQQQTSSSRKLKNLWLLAVRILAIIFLVFAFARPYIPSGTSSVASRQVVSIYLDNSYSMEAINREGSLLDEAKRRAKEIASAYGLNDKFQLITNDFEGRHQRLLSREEFFSAVEEVKVSGISRTLLEILNRQQQVFSTEVNISKIAYIVSDFQENMLEKTSVKLDSSIDLRIVRLKASAQANISIDSVWFMSPVHKFGSVEKLVIKLKNNSDTKVENIPYKLKIDDQQKAIGSLTLDARKSKQDTISFSGLSAGWKKGEISITDYPVVFDDQFFFTFQVDKLMNILAINESGENPYLTAVYRADSFFKLSNTNLGNINYSVLGSYQMIILNGTADVSSGLIESLKSYIGNGGNLMIFPSLSGDLSGLKALGLALGTDLPVSISDQRQKVVNINLRHPFFRDVFEQLPRNLDLPVADKSVNYTNQSRTTKQSILEFAGGRTFLSQYNLGKGKVYLSAVGLEGEESNFVKHSVFVPIMFQAAFLSLRDNRLFYTIGKDQFLESSKISLNPNQTLKLKKGDFEIIPDLRQTETISRIYISDQIRDHGIYNLMKGDSLLASYAFNDNRSESDLSYLNPDELREILPGDKIQIFNPGNESVSGSIKAVNYGVQLWKLCLILALVFLAAEILIIRIYKPGKAKLNN